MRRKLCDPVIMSQPTKLFKRITNFSFDSPLLFSVPSFPSSRTVFQFSFTLPFLLLFSFNGLVLFYGQYYPEVKSVQDLNSKCERIGSLVCDFNLRTSQSSLMVIFYLLRFCYLWNLLSFKMGNHKTLVVKLHSKKHVPKS